MPYSFSVSRHWWNELKNLGMDKLCIPALMSVCRMSPKDLEF